MVDWLKLRRELLGEYDSARVPPKISIPVMPQAMLTFLQRADDPDATAAELGKVIEADSGLTVELLRYLNSSAFAMRQKVSSAQRAIAILGINRCKLFLLSASMQKVMTPKKMAVLNPEAFAASNLERGLFAAQVAKFFECDADLCFAGGMLCDAVLPSLVNEMSREYQAYEAIPAPQKEPLTDYEKKLIQWDHGLAAGMIMLGWKFPDDLICCVLLHHSAYQILSREDLRRSEAAAIAIAALLPEQLLQMPKGVAVLLKLGTVFPGFPLSEICQKVDAQMGEQFPGLTREPLEERIQNTLKILS